MDLSSTALAVLCVCVSLAVATEFGTIYATGNKAWGQLGDGLESPTTTIPVKVSVPGNVLYQKKAVIGTVSAVTDYVITDNREVYSWGGNWHAELGNGKQGGFTNHPELIDFATFADIEVQEISSFNKHVLLLSTGGHVYSWGSNEYGQIGNGAGGGNVIYLASQKTPVYVNPLLPPNSGRIREVAAGGLHSVLIEDETGYVYVAGANEKGQLCLGFNSFVVNKYQRIESLVDKNIRIKHVSAGMRFTILVDYDGNVYTCGANTLGQLGLGDDAFLANETVNSPTLISDKAPLKGEEILDAYAGTEHAILLSASKKMFCMGSHATGQCGMGLTQPQQGLTPGYFPTPVDITNLIEGTPQHINVGWYSSFITTTDGSLFVCGENDLGQLGIGSRENQYTWVNVLPSFPEGTLIQQAFGGMFSSMFITGEIPSLTTGGAAFEPPDDDFVPPPVAEITTGGGEPEPSEAPTEPPAPTNLPSTQPPLVTTAAPTTTGGNVVDSSGSSSDSWWVLGLVVAVLICLGIVLAIGYYVMKQRAVGKTSTFLPS